MAVILVIWLIASASALAQTETGKVETTNNQTLKVAVAIMPPCVMYIDGQYRGFDIDIWEEIAKRCDIPYEYVQMPFNKMLSSVKAGETSLAISGISITEKREEFLDFSYPYFKVGLMVLANSAESDSVANSVGRAIVGLIISWNFVKFIGILVLMLTVLALTLMVFEHWGEDNPTLRKGWLGISDAYWCIWAQMTTMGFGDIVPKKVLGRLLSLPSYVSGSIVLAIIVSSVTAAVTVTAMKKEEANIKSPRDFFSKTISTVKDTTSVDFLDLYDARIIAETTPEEAFAKFISGEAEAMVYDSPTIMYFYNNYHGDKKISMLSDLFDEQYYGIALPSGSPWRESVNRAILQIQEDGTYKQIYNKWFGKI